MDPDVKRLEDLAKEAQFDYEFHTFSAYEQHWAGLKQKGAVLNGTSSLDQEYTRLGTFLARYILAQPTEKLYAWLGRSLTDNP
ncbi:MAG: hypothetical protein ABIH41_00045 [Nanoarchaeota archaeon]